LLALLGGGWVLVYLLLPTPDKPRPELFKEAKENFNGISPAIGACYVYGTNAAAVIISVAIGAAIGTSYIFGTFLYKIFRVSSSFERQLFWKAVEDRMKDPSTELREVIIEFREYEKLILDRRNIYWSLFARVTLAILVVGLIGLLISTCKVESQAGLPIISGIIAFIIGQGSELVHAAATPVVVSQPRNPPDGDTSRPSPPKPTP
jgi:hypothetical protein